MVVQPLDGVQVRFSGVHGHGVLATRALKAGEEIGCYAGRNCETSRTCFCHRNAGGVACNSNLLKQLVA